MNYLSLRIWFLVTIALALGAVIVRLVWGIATTTSVGSLLVITLLILAILSFYGLLTYLAIKPSVKKLRSRPAGIWVLVMATAGIISAVIHFIRFIPSSEASTPLSVIIAALLLMAGVSGYLLLLWLIWSIWKAKRSQF